MHPISHVSIPRGRAGHQPADLAPAPHPSRPIPGHLPCWPNPNICVTNRKVTMDGRDQRPMTNRVTTISITPDPVKSGVGGCSLDCQNG
jgi:hypothetical protein